MPSFFDKIYFPGVWVPVHGIDRKAIEDMIVRLRAQPDSFEANNATRINLLMTTLQGKDLRSFCVFPGDSFSNVFPPLEEGAEELGTAIEDLYFGPHPEGFYPTRTTAHSVGLPGDEDLCLAYPGLWTYSANALLFARRHHKILVNDDPRIPVPGVPSVSPRGNATVLSRMLALEAVRFALPNLKPMEPAAIADFREDTKQYVRPFRDGMLRLSKELNQMLAADADLEDARRQARFIVDTTIAPDLRELARVIEDPSKPWYRHAVDLIKDTPELVQSFTSMPTSLAFAKLFAKIAGILADYADDRRMVEKQKQSSLYYLLRLQQLAGRTENL